MRKFVNALFGGYRKQDVDEYVSFLENELEALKADTNQRLERQNDTLNELRTQMVSVDSEKERLTKELESISVNGNDMDELLKAKEQELQNRLAEVTKKDDELKALKEKLSDTERKLTEAETDADSFKDKDGDIYALIADTKKNIKELEKNAQNKAAGIEYQATEKAKKIRQQGVQDALDYKKEAQEEIKQGVEQVKLAKYDLYEYLVSIKKAQDNMMNTYKELGTILNKFPAKMEELALDASFELKADSEFKWHDPNADPDDETASHTGTGKDKVNKTSESEEKK